MTFRFPCLIAVLMITACGAQPSELVIDDVVLQQHIAVQHEEALTLLRPSHKDRYPIMLVHGMAGFRPIARFIDYFYRVRVTVTADGYEVFASQTDPFQSVSYRARQLAIQVDEALRLSGASKLHLIAHSQGGLDARYLISSLGYGDRIATLTTVGTPHHGVKIVDMALQLSPAWVGRLATIINALSDGLLGGHADLVAQLHDLTHHNMQQVFNPKNLDDDRVAYYSYSGQTQANPFVNLNHFDLVNPLLAATYQFTHAVEGDNDGVVSVESTRWGTYLGAFPADHWDEIGQPPTTGHPSFNHLRFYSDLSHFLASVGDAPQY